MSAHGHATPGDARASHDHHYEGVPADRPGPDEPRTPLWLPLVGLGLFLLVLFAYLVTRPPGKTGDELAKEAAPEPAAAAPASAPPSPRMRLPGLPSAFAPNARKLDAPQPGAAPPAAAPRPTASAEGRMLRLPPAPRGPRPRSAEPAPPAPAQ